MAKSSSKSADKKVEKVKAAAPKVEKKDEKKKASVAQDPVGNGKVSPPCIMSWCIMSCS